MKKETFKMKMNQWLKHSKLFLSIILALFVVIASIIFIKSKDEIIYKITANSGEIYVTSLKIGETTQYFDRIEKNTKNVKLDGDELVLKQGAVLIFKTSQINDFNILFNSKKSLGTVNIEYGNKNKEYSFNKKSKFETFSVNKGLKAECLSFVKNASIIDCITMILVYFTGFIIIYYILLVVERYINKINSDSINIKDISLLFLSMLTLFLLVFYPILELLNWLVVVPLIIYIIYIIYKIKNIKDIKLHNIFPLIAITFGLLFAFIIPPFHVPDEGAHFMKAYSIFDKRNIKKINNNGYFNYPIGEKNLYTKYGSSVSDGENKFSVKDYYYDLHYSKQENEAKEETWFGNTYYLPALNYLPAAIMVKVLSMINCPYILLPLFGRLINLYIFIILGFLALRKIPIFKKILFLVMLLPLTINQVAAINQDSMTLSIIFFFVSCLVNYIYNKNARFNKTDFVKILILTILLCFSKTGYFPIVFLTLLIPKEKFKNSKYSKLMKLSIIGITFILTFFSYLNYSTNLASGTIPIDTLFKDPITIILMVIRTICARFPDDTFALMVNGFGWSTIWNNNLINYICILLIFIVLFFDNKEPKVNFKHRLIFGIIALTIMALIYASLLFGWTTPSSLTIAGLQTRYFIPYTLLLCFALNNKLISINVKNRNLVAIISILIILTLVQITTISGFYQ